MVCASEDGLALPRFLKESVAYIGWGDVGPVVPTDSREDIRRRLDKMNPVQGDGARPNIVGMLRRFCCEIRVGDVVFNEFVAGKLPAVLVGANGHGVVWWSLVGTALWTLSRGFPRDKAILHARGLYQRRLIGATGKSVDGRGGGAA